MKNIYLKLGFFLIMFFTINSSMIDNMEIVKVTFLNQNPNPAYAGDFVDIYLVVENYGGLDIQDLILEIEPKYPLKKVQGENYTIRLDTVHRYLTNMNRYLVNFRLAIDKDANQGEYEIELKRYKLDDKFKTVITDKINISVISRQFPQITQISEINLMPGEMKNISFTIKNVGRSSIKDLIFSFENKDNALLSMGSDNTRYVNSLDINESKELSFMIMADPNINSGLYVLDLNMVYSDILTNEQKQVNTKSAIFIGGTTSFELTLSDISSSGMSFYLVNIGQNPAYSVVAKIPEQNGFTISTKNTDVVGNIQRDDYTSISFDVTKNRQSQKDDLLIEIYYTDTLGIRRKIQREITIKENNQITTSTVIEERDMQQFQRGGVRANPLSALSSIGNSISLINIIIFVVGISFAYIIIKKIYKKIKKILQKSKK